MKGFKKHKYLKTALCFGVGAVLLTAAAFANYDNASGYSVCKNAAKQLLFETNFSTNYQVAVKLDGNPITESKGVYQTNGGGNPARYDMMENAYYYELGGEPKVSKRESIQQDGLSVYVHTNEDGEQYSSANKIYPNMVNGVEVNTDDGSFIGGGSDMAEKAITFGEKLCDTLVGDLKNSIIQVDSADGLRTYQASLTGNQMPDLVASGVSLAVSSIKNSVEVSREYREENGSAADYQSIDDILYDSMFAGGDPVIDSANGSMTVNESGLPVHVNGSVSFTGFDAQGNAHTMEFTLNADFSDYGTTAITPMDIYALPDLRIFDRGDSTYVINMEASEEEQAEIRAQAEEEASYGNTVRIIDQNGKELAVMNGGENSGAE
ncbi:hypothetical protein [Ructibacterium gallinarum]|uniref:Uncharacterized protein n=1 Tax=Ructibacterium gallinarum TaxID=2779355 RepID=A0A9D5M663_9FIRM|nr:hypothetical protein [Ructibacterium gallinarum]MBE5040217.1 hypothetical protein [Ructibacterium gallinarum]